MVGIGKKGKCTIKWKVNSRITLSFLTFLERLYVYKNELKPRLNMNFISRNSKWSGVHQHLGVVTWSLTLSPIHSTNPSWKRMGQTKVFLRILFMYLLVLRPLSCIFRTFTKFFSWGTKTSFLHFVKKFLVKKHYWRRYQ